MRTGTMANHTDVPAGEHQSQFGWVAAPRSDEEQYSITLGLHVNQTRDTATPEGLITEDSATAEEIASP